MEDYKVILIGAGPGDAKLLTIKAAEYLGKASFILIDRLVNPEIVQQFANPTAKIFYVGKHGGHISANQNEIETLLIECALQPGITVRLKGGDVAFFSNALSEIGILNKNNIPYEIVPGITAASGAAASLGISLTARKSARGVRFLTYQYSSANLYFNWDDLAHTSDTLIFYMASRGLSDLVESMNHYSRHDKSIAVIEQATTPQERVFKSSLNHFEKELGHIQFKQPALVIIGEVVKLFSQSPSINFSTTSFFKEHNYANRIAI